MYFNTRAIFLFILLSIIGAGWGFSQNHPPVTRLSITEGLSNNSVRCVFQDKKGLMWFGTFDGLNRYDGYGFKIYRNQPKDSSSLSHNYIYAIAEDKNQNIWIGTGQGVNILDPEVDRFSWAYYRDWYTHQILKLSYSITYIKADHYGNLFIGTNNAGLYIKPRYSNLCVQLPAAVGPNAYRALTCEGMAVSKNNTVWIFMADVGLCRYNYRLGKLDLVNNSLKSVNCINAADDGAVWLGTTKGLFKYVIDGNSITGGYRVGAGHLSGDNVVSLLFTDKRQLYIGTDGGGLSILNLATNRFSYADGEGMPGLVKSKVIMDLYQDEDLRIWIATMRSGINIIDPKKSNFGLVAHQEGVANSLINNFVSSFCEYDNDNIWIGTEDGGLSVWNRKKNQFKNFTHLGGNTATLSSNAVTSILKDYLGRVWVATFAGGINRYGAAGKSFEHFECKNNSTGEVNKDVWLLFEDRHKTLWAGTFSNGRLYRFNRKKNEFDVFDQKISDPYVFFEDRRGQLWCGTSEFLIKVDTVSKSHTFYRIDKPVRAIYEDRSGLFWLGTEGGGLCLFDRIAGKVKQRFTDAEGLSNNAVLNILEDRAGKLWLSTFQGLTSFDYKHLSFNNYYQSDGLQSNQFSFNAALRLKSGQLAFGGIKGFNIFYPDSIVTHDDMPNIVFTNINVNNKRISDVNFIKDNGSGIPRLKVPYNDAVLSFSFAGLEYSSPEHIKYAYYLEGWDKNWVFSGAQRTINYNNLPEGSYTLHVKSTNTSGKWNTKQIVLNVIVLPPWFRTVWAYLIYGALAAALAYIYIRYRTIQENLKHQIKQERLNSENEHQMNLRKTSFFTHVSHEFRTPLMLIINPLQEVLSRNGQRKDPELGIVYRNARRLISLIDQLLLFNKTENDATDLQINELNFYALCKLTFESFVYQAKNRNIRYEFHSNLDHIVLFGDKAKLEVILYNLLSNAFKFVNAEGVILFKLRETGNTVEVSVCDNGCGIPPEAGNRLFEKFYRSSNQQSGFGIGLYLVHQFVQQHKAQISYVSNAEQGTTFFVNLKKGRLHFQDMPVWETPNEDAVFLNELSGDQELVNWTELDDTPDQDIHHHSKAVVDDDDNLTGPQLTYSKKTMLVIDDHPDMRTYIKQIFRDQFILLEASDGAQGIQLAKEYIPDIILSDIMMDVKDGLELCRDIRENPSLAHIPLILITASPSADIKVGGIKGGADDYFTKPLNKELLTARINTLLQNRNNLQNYFYRKVTLKEHHVKISEEEKRFIDQCIVIIEGRLEDDDFNVDQLAREINMSRSNIFKKVKAISNQTPNNFIKYVRLRRAAELFINSSHNVNEVSMLVGFKDVKYFREQFFQLFGLNPSEYIKKYRNPFSKKISFHFAQDGKSI